MSRGLQGHRYFNAPGIAAWPTFLFCLLALATPLTARAAVEQHLFDPTISLTGGCGSEKYDEIPDPWCPGPPEPSAPFENPNIAIDSVGDMYVSSHEDSGTAGRVDVFTPDGQFITEVNIPGARALAVDSEGNLYVHQLQSGGLHQVSLFRPTGTYDPEAGEIAYEEPGEVFIKDANTAPFPCSDESAVFLVGLAVDPETNNLFVSPGGGCVGEWSPPGSSPGEPPELLDPTVGSGTLSGHSFFVAVDGAHNRLYVSDQKATTSEGDLIQAFELEAPHAPLGSIDGHSTANGKLLAFFGQDTIAVDEASGHLIVSELAATPKVYEFGMGLGASEELLETYEYPGFQAGASPLQVAVDNAEASPNYRSFFVPSEGKPNPHTFAFRFSTVGPPEVETVSAAGITETEAVLNATINPNGAATTYRFEYTTAPSGWAGATVAGQGTLPSGIAGIPVSVPITGLAPGTAYRFRAVAENECEEGKPLCRREAEDSFTTYPTPLLGGPCANEALRIGPSAALPDCRAYELVTPADTNGRSPRGAAFTGRYFPTLQASPDGNRASFRVEGGSIPGFGAAGAGNGDNYLARRGSGGWSTERAGPTGAEVPAPRPGAFSEDQGYSLWSESLTAGGTTFIRYPDGHSEPVGRGSLGVDGGAEAKLIAPDASHTIFESQQGSAIRLEPDAPPAGTAAIYDRTADEVTHVVSLLPGGATPAPGQDAKWVGNSLDGTGVAFLLKGSDMLYLRQNNQETYEAGEGLTYAGIAEGGGRLFYLKGGDLFAYDTATKAPIRFSSGGDATPVNVSPDGRVAYFISPDVLTSKANPNGAHAKAGKDNLYRSREGQIAFVATVKAEDVEEEFGTAGESVGLGRWIGSLASRPAIETSRTTPDGGVLVFESRAPLTAYDPAGHKEIYRYDGAALTCLSCNPTGAAPSAGNASLQTVTSEVSSEVLGLADRMLNLNTDGSRAFFQSYEPLVAADTDQRQDVYEWEAQGLGSCARSGGCVYLISGPSSQRDEHLFAASASGEDVFILSGDLLTGADKDTTPSIYDARVGGGFPEAEAAEPCQGEGCRGELTPAPALLPPSSPVLGKSGNLTQRHCPKGKRKARRHGKTRCVARHRHRAHHHHKGKGKSR